MATPKKPRPPGRPRRARRARPSSRTSSARASEAAVQGIAARAVDNLARKIQAASVATLNGLVEAGPTWSGALASSWDVVPVGQAPRMSPRAVGRIYKYTKSNFPLARFTNAMKKGSKLKSVTFGIYNTVEHFDIAIDAVESRFSPPEDYPNPVTGAKVERGWGDNPRLRGDLELSPIGNERRTAPLDWFTTYALGGELDRDFGSGFRLGFRMLGA